VLSREHSLYADLLADGRRDGKGDLSRTSVHAVHVTVGRMLKDAVRWGPLARNVAAFADPPSVDHLEMAIWTPEQPAVVAASRLVAGGGGEIGGRPTVLSWRLREWACEQPGCGAGRRVEEIPARH
jgi:hypothetical protein